MTGRFVHWFLVVAVGLILVACGYTANDVPSLKTTDEAQVVEPAADPADDLLDDEAKVMVFTQCMRDQGIELVDPVVDPDGNVQDPELAEGVEVSREEYGAAYAECGAILEGITFGKERQDVSAQVDHYIEIADCLRDKGYDMDDPTAETFNQWLTGFRAEFDWNDPEAVAAYQACM